MDSTDLNEMDLERSARTEKESAFLESALFHGGSGEITGELFNVIAPYDELDRSDVTVDRYGVSKPSFLERALCVAKTVISSIFYFFFHQTDAELFRHPVQQSVTSLAFLK